MRPIILAVFIFLSLLGPALCQEVMPAFLEVGKTYRIYYSEPNSVAVITIIGAGKDAWYYVKNDTEYQWVNFDHVRRVTAVEPK